jgi:hypothetical protein
VQYTRQIQCSEADSKASLCLGSLDHTLYFGSCAGAVLDTCAELFHAVRSRLDASSKQPGSNDTCGQAQLDQGPTLINS